VFDYKSAGQDAIAKANPVVKADKIDKIWSIIDMLVCTFYFLSRWFYASVKENNVLSLDIYLFVRVYMYSLVALLIPCLTIWGLIILLWISDFL
jgi:hypothetical protein